MDLGFAGLIDKIEERFGPILTNFLFVLIFIAIVSWFLELIASTYVSGMMQMQGQGIKFALGLSKVLLVHVSLILCTSVVCYSIYKRMQNKTVEAVRVFGDQTRKEIKDFGEQKIQEVKDRGASIADQTKQRIDTVIEEARSEIRRYKNMK